jgi:transcriptional regulator with XRE-family HTH domain
MSSNPTKRTISPGDPRLNQLVGMRERGLSQAEMARALGASQPTISRLLHYIDSLSSEQAMRIADEPKPNELREMIAAEDKRRAIREQIYEAYHAGDMARVAELRRAERAI